MFTLSRSRYYFALTVLLVGTFYISQARAAETFCPGGTTPSPNVIWCDSFEDEDLGPNGTVAENYHEFNTDDGDHVRVSSEHIHGSNSLRARWQVGETDAGHFMRNFGRNPIGSQSHAQQNFAEIYWRFYVKMQSGFVGFPDKYTRATIFAGSNWQQAMIAHVWADSGARQSLLMDPASGINSQSQLATTQWNDFPNLIWLGARRGTTTLQPGRWYCIEAHVKLNDVGQNNGVFEFWVDDNLETSRTDLNWVRNWTDYGINSVFFSHYWNNGSPAEQERFLDALVISTQRIGCLSTTRPNPPTGLQVQ